MIWLSYEFSGFYRLEVISTNHLTFTGGKVADFSLNFSVSNHIRETTGRGRKPKAKKGRGKWQMKEKGMMERGKAIGEVRQSKKRRKEGRKGKQVELLMLAIMFLPGQSISKTCYDIKYPQLSKTTDHPVLAEWCAYVCIWGVTGVTEAGVPAVSALLGD